jgi:hypothetical protein
MSQVAALFATLLALSGAFYMVSNHAGDAITNESNIYK